MKIFLIHKVSCQFYCRKTNINEEFRRINDNKEKNEANSCNNEDINGDCKNDGYNWSTLLEGRVLKPLGISMGIMFFQQATGANAIIFHTVSIFHMSGSKLDGRYSTIIVGFVQVVITIASGFFVCDDNIQFNF